MADRTELLLNKILESLERLEYVKPSDIPNIDLYMDQVTTFMDSRLRSGVRNPGEDKILTKTMINNYAKNDLLPPPVKKKYSKEHVLLLIFIFYYKGIMSISDIQTLLTPITEQFFHNDKDFNLESIYEEVFRMEKSQVECLKKDIVEKYKLAKQTFEDAPDENLEFLQKFAFICLLSFDVYEKKMIIEKLIDDISHDRGGSEGKGKKTAKADKETGK